MSNVNKKSKKESEPEVSDQVEDIEHKKEDTKNEDPETMEDEKPISAKKTQQRAA